METRSPRPSVGPGHPWKTVLPPCPWSDCCLCLPEAEWCGWGRRRGPPGHGPDLTRRALSHLSWGLGLRWCSSLTHAAPPELCTCVTFPGDVLLLRGRSAACSSLAPRTPFPAVSRAAHCGRGSGVWVMPGGLMSPGPQVMASVCRDQGWPCVPEVQHLCSCWMRDGVAGWRACH